MKPENKNNHSKQWLITRILQSIVEKISNIIQNTITYCVEAKDNPANKLKDENIQAMVKATKANDMSSVSPGTPPPTPVTPLNLTTMHLRLNSTSTPTDEMATSSPMSNFNIKNLSTFELNAKEPNSDDDIVNISAPGTPESLSSFTLSSSSSFFKTDVLIEDYDNNSNKDSENVIEQGYVTIKT